jgi:hypothetical protein
VLLASAVALAATFVALPAGPAGAAQNILRADKSVPRSCFAKVQP